MTPETDDKAQDAATRLVARLQNLYSGPLALPQIISLGKAAVPALEACLRGPSQALYHPRALAADALAAIGGKDARASLIRALRDSIARQPDPFSQEAEAVMVSHIAEHLSAHRSPAVIDALLHALRTRPLAACARTLGELGDRRAIPLLVDCLAEDAARSAAMTALRRFGRETIAPLRALLGMPHYVHGIEPPTHIDGRTAAATLLGELGDRSPLLRALYDRERSVRLAAAMGLAATPATAPERAIQLLLQGLDERDWACAHTSMQSLLPLGPSLTGALGKILADNTSDEAAQRRHRRAALLAGRLGLASAAPSLAALSCSDDPQLRLAAVDALAQIAAAEESQLAAFLADRQLTIAARAFHALTQRRPVGVEDISRWLEHTSAWKSPLRRWWRIWRLLALARSSR